MRIVSGGQTGADRAALDVARELGLPAGGWVPRGRAAEDGPVPESYEGLRETEEDDPAARTRFNARDSDATVVLSHGPVGGGSRLALEEAGRLGRPALHLDLRRLSEEAAATRLREWIADVRPAALNVAGPRASEDPAIGDAATRVLRAALRTVVRPPERLETRRLLLRRPVRGDTEAVFAYAHDPDVTRYLAWRPHGDPEETRAFLRRCDDVWAKGTAFPWTVTDRSGRVLGMIELRLADGEANLGYVLAREHWGRGITTEAVARVRDWVLAETTVPRLWAICDVDNVASARVLEKCGFAREAGSRPGYHPNAGRTVRECQGYAILRGNAERSP